MISPGPHGSLHAPAVQLTAPLFLRNIADPIMPMPWMMMPHTTFGLPMKRKVVVKIAILQRMKSNECGVLTGLDHEPPVEIPGIKGSLKDPKGCFNATTMI
ncbi:MAG: hypothetical protein ABSE07_12600 [Methanoregula sp.]|jgi:hypothetical protein